MPSNKNRTIKELLDIPWMGLRPDLKIFPGPIEDDGQRSWILEDPVRGNNFRLGYTEGEILYRLNRYQDPDAALASLYATTPLRPSIESAAAFIVMLQKESLAIMPSSEVVSRESKAKRFATPSLFQKLLQGYIFYQKPLLRPDTFLTRTLPWISKLWSPVMKWIYILCAIAGIILTVPEIELYFATVSYLFTPQGAVSFFLCVVLLKIGHEFAHAYTAKSMGLHVRSMGIYFIVLWPLLYTDTTDAWKIPDRRRRMWISAAGIIFELTVAGIALLFWAVLPDGILKSLMFFLSSTSIITSFFINLNPFMRYDGYYILMDHWGIDNLRHRSYAMLRYEVRRMFFGWKAPAPEIHPNRRGLIIYGFLALLYRLFIGFSIALAAYYFLIPTLGLIVLLFIIWLFILRPLLAELKGILINRRYIGSKFRLCLTLAGFLSIFILIFLPIPRFNHLPCLLLYKGTTPVSSPALGQISHPLPVQGQTVSTGELITRIDNDSLIHELETARFDLASTKASLETLGGGGEQGAYRNWLLAEEGRLKAEVEKLNQAIAQLEIRSPIDGQIVDVNQDLYESAFISKGTYIFTVANPSAYEIKAFVHEKLVNKLHKIDRAVVRFPQFNTPDIDAVFQEKSVFPVQNLPNESLLDIGGGPIVSVADTLGRRPRDAYFVFFFDVRELPVWMPHGLPSWIWVKSESYSIAGQIAAYIWKHFNERSIF